MVVPRTNKSGAVELGLIYRACPLLGVLHIVCVDDGYVCYLLAGYANLQIVPSLVYCREKGTV